MLSGLKLSLSLPLHFLNPGLPFWNAHRVVGRVYFSSGATWKKKVNRKHMGMVCERSVCLCLKKILQEEYVRLAKCLGCLKSGLWPLALDWRHLIGTKSSCCCSLSGILAIRKIKKITWIILMAGQVRKSKMSFFPFVRGWRGWWWWWGGV